MRHNPVVVSHHQECVNNNEHHQEQVHEQEKRVRSETAAMAAETAALTSTAAAESSSVNSNANTSSININKSVGTPVLWSTPRPKQTTATPTSAEAPTSTNQLGHRSYGARQGLFWLHAVSTSCGGGSGQSSCQTTVTKLNAPPPPPPPCDSPNNSPSFALGARDVCLVGESPTCSVPVLYRCEGLLSCDYGYA